jgi:hypothetical protein
VEHLKGASLG